MLRCSRILANGLALFCLSALAAAQSPQPEALPPQPEAQSPQPTALTKEEMASAVQTDALSIPTPGELFSALNKLGKLDWPSKFRPPIATNFSSRAQMALNLGGLIADGYIAVEAQDAQQVKNIGKDILALAKPLGVQQDIINRGKSLTDFASEGKWDVLKEELEATQNEAKSAMAENKDPDLVTLVTVGGWIRGTETMSSYLTENFSVEGAKLLRQPGIVKFLNQRLSAISPKMQDDPCVKKARLKLNEIEKSLDLPLNSEPTRDFVISLNRLVSELLQDISRKDSK